MRIPKWFEKWYWKKYHSFQYVDVNINLAWKAYYKGKKDGAKQYSIDLDDLIKELKL